jgi:hypothetical protein
MHGHHIAECKVQLSERLLLGSIAVARSIEAGPELPTQTTLRFWPAASWRMRVS